MITPVPVEGRLDCYGQPLVINGPHPFVQELESYLAPESLVADIGSFSGNDGLYLAQLGHRLAAVDIKLEALKDGIHKAEALGAVAARSLFINGDVRQLMFRDGQFDAVIALHMLQLLPKQDIPQAIDEIQRTTSAGGLNAIKVYAGTSHEIAVRPRYSIFEFGALKRVYESSGWETLHYDEHHIEPANNDDGISSYAKLIARKPNTQVSRTRPTGLRSYMNANRQIVYLDEV
jgi:SAM-dependent methyltransferase